MRLKEDNSSWNASNVLKKDFKHTSSDPIPVHKSKKNTTKWCRGKIGTEHDYKLKETKRYDFWLGFTYYTYKCSTCGKKLIQSSR